MEPPRASLLAVAVLAVLCACARDDPASPALASIAGRVFLTGSQIDASARFIGTRTVTDADGVPVELIYGNRVLARTTTSAGAYRFDGLGPGGYTVRVQVGGAISDVTRPLTLVAGRQLVVGDTLHLASRGDLYPAPNPVGDSTTIFFDVAQLGIVRLSIVDLAGNTVNSLVDRELPEGSVALNWYGRDEAGALVSDRLYWLVYAAPDLGDFRAHLLFRWAAPAAPAASEGSHRTPPIGASRARP